MQKTRKRTALWIFVVYLFSFLCYLPAILRQFGGVIPDVFLRLKACFVLIPALISLLFLAGERSLKGYFSSRFKKISLKEIALCGGAALLGVLTTGVFAFVEKFDLFHSTYSSILSFGTSCGYLFLTALVEEVAWRGFLLERVEEGRRSVTTALVVGVIWAGWHLPMWIIRNSLSGTEIVPLFLWTVLISLVLGSVYSAFRNILSVALLHMIFNVCFLAPVGYNTGLLFFGILLFALFSSYKKGRS